MADLLDRITINPDQCGGRPCIRTAIRALSLTPTHKSIKMRT